MEGFYIMIYWQPTAAVVLNTSHGAKDQGFGRALSHLPRTVRKLAMEKRIQILKRSGYFDAQNSLHPCFREVVHKVSLTVSKQQDYIH